MFGGLNSECCLGPASKYSGCKATPRASRKRITDKKRETDGVSWAIADPQTPADRSLRSGRGGPPSPSWQSRYRCGPDPAVPAASLLPIPKQTSPAHGHRRSFVLRGAGHVAPEVNGQEAPGASRSPAGEQRPRGCPGLAAASLPAPRSPPTPHSASPPPRHAAGWT